jgi:DNA invertase Pin-like site-specific DNA recombinase
MSATHLTTRRPTVAYYRCSDPRQEASIPEQRAWCRQAAEREGLHVLAEFEDEGIPGSEIEDRPGLMAMLAFCQARTKDQRVEVILCWDGDRLSRASAIRTAAVLDRLMTSGVSYVFSSEGWVDLEDEGHVLIHNIKQGMGRAGYVHSLSKNVTRSAVARARQGLWTGGKPPYGYRVGDDGRLVVYEPEAEIVRWLFDRYANTTDSLGDLARALNERGVEPPGMHVKRKRKNSEPLIWRRDIFHKLLNNRKYLGESIWNVLHVGKYSRVSSGTVEKVRGQRDRSVREKNSEEDRVVMLNAHPALVDPETFTRVGAKLVASRWKRTAPLPGSGEWVLSGLLRCGNCGNPMYGRTERHVRGHEPGTQRTYTYRKYFCGANLRTGKGSCKSCSVLQDVVVRAVAVELREVYRDPSRLLALEEDLAARAAQANQQAQAELAQLEESIATLDANIAQGEKNILLAPAHLIETLARRLDEWRQERETRAQRRAELIAASEARTADTEQICEALEALAEIEEAISEAPAREVRAIVERLVTRVTVIFDHSLPKSKNHATHIEIEFHPDIANLLPTGRRGRSRIRQGGSRASGW